MAAPPSSLVPPRYVDQTRIDPPAPSSVTNASRPPPGVACAVHATPGGGRDAFVTELGAGGSILVWSTYLGGTSDDGGAAIATDIAGNVYVAGATSSSDFPTALAIQP